jgi:hypothetical protein
VGTIVNRGELWGMAVSTVMTCLHRQRTSIAPRRRPNPRCLRTMTSCSRPHLRAADVNPIGRHGLHRHHQSSRLTATALGPVRQFGTAPRWRQGTDRMAPRFRRDGGTPLPPPAGRWSSSTRFICDARMHHVEYVPAVVDVGTPDHAACSSPCGPGSVRGTRLTSRCWLSLPRCWQSSQTAPSSSVCQVT